MKRISTVSLLVLATVVLAVLIGSCKKDEETTAPTNVPLYPVSATVLNPAGLPQGGATLSLKNPPNQAGTFSAITDSAGRATIQSPAGLQTLVAKIGTVFQSEITVNVAASASGTNAGTITLQQNTQLGRVLVVYAGCEQLEDVLRSDSIRFNTFDTTTVQAMRQRATADSVGTLNYLRTYSLVFSDCDCGSENPYALLARIYGRYVEQGGKIYGGHYNWMNLYKIFPPFYLTQTNLTGDSLSIIDINLSTALGFTVTRWTGYPFTGYQRFSDMPTGGASTVYAVITRTNPAVPVIVENRKGLGKYLWTVYHNQDILTDPRLVKIVRYFLYTL